MTEAELQEHVRAACKQLGLAHFHVRDSRGMEPGFPDSVIISPRGRGILYRELKSASGTLTPAQKRAGRMLAANHCDYAVWRPADWLDGTITRQLAGIAGFRTREAG